MTLRLSDPALTERLAAFLSSLGERVTSTGEGVVVIDREIPPAELRIFLRVWSVLHPEGTITVA